MWFILRIHNFNKIKINYTKFINHKMATKLLFYI